jgi:putative ABC transport system ATP-binding protein
MSLVVTDLAKRYGDVAVFEHVSLTVAPGEFVAIVGESGVGKSTLLNCMAGLDNWDSGTVSLDGVDLGTLGDDARALLRREKVGFVFQAFHVLPHLDVAQNVALPLLLLHRPDAARVQAMLDAVGLGDLGARLPQQLSGGQLQRVATSTPICLRCAASVIARRGRRLTDCGPSPSCATAASSPPANWPSARLPGCAPCPSAAWWRATQAMRCGKC